MKKLLSFLLIAFTTGGCNAPADQGASAPAQKPTITLKVPPSQLMEVPERKKPASDTDWEARVINKNIEVIQLINIITPVKDYLVVGFTQYGPKFSEDLNHEWKDTQEQLGAALALYEKAGKAKGEGQFSQQTFFMFEEVWQLLVKTGVAGVRTKSMMDSELKRMSGQ